MSCGFDPNTYPPSNVIVQQTFMGLSIMDFSINLGFNSNSSSLSVNLVKDDANYHTWLDLNGCRDAVTEGYHPWDKEAYPKDLIALYGGTPPYALHKQDISGDLPYFPPPGSPVYFNYYSGDSLTASCTGATYRDCEPVFSFPGILTKYERAWGSSGETYSVSITDPRQILENTKIILDGYAGRTATADAHFNFDSTRVFDQGWNGYYNIINVYGYYENHRFQNSGKTSSGMVWFAPGSGPVVNEYGANTFRGILPAIDFLISGTNKNYIEAMEPFGGPIYYNEDVRQIKTNPPFGLQNNLSTDIPYNVHRYAVDLSDLYNLSAYWNTNPTAPGVLPDDFRISGESMSLLQLVQQVCDRAGCDFFVWLYVPRHPAMKFWNTHRNYSGIIKVTPIRKDLNIRTGVLKDAFDQSIMVPPKGPWVDAEKNSTLVSANLGYEFTDPISGQMLLGAPRTRVVGVTPLGDFKYRRELFFNKGDKAYLSGVPKENVDDILKEFLPSSENDGVSMHWANFPKDEFYDKSERGWNPYSDTSLKGRDNRQDFQQNLPSVSNDDYMPEAVPFDYGKMNADDKRQVDPFQLNRVNSKWTEDNVNYEGGSGLIDLFPCWGFETSQDSLLSPELNDIIDRTQRGSPIKGFFWDDDPYNDFHPTDGIFGTLEFYNPGLGKCVAIRNPDADKDGQGETSTEDVFGTEINYTVGQEIPNLENKPKLCECNYRAAVETGNLSDPCLLKGDPIPGKFVPYCKPYRTCKDHEGNLIEGFQNDLGEGNKIHLTEYGCTQGCFQKDDNDKPTGNPIAAYYIADFGDKKKGQRASSSDEAWKKAAPGTIGSVIKIVKNEQECVESGNLLDPTEERISAPIASDGLTPETDPDKENEFEKSGGLYDSKCKAVSSRELCLSHCKDANGLMTDELNAKVCEEDGGTWFDALTENCDGFTDELTGEVIPKEENPSPGYANVRARVAKNSKDELMPVQPRTATIPIDLKQIGFEGGPNGNRNYGADGARNWYYATVSELRHAAVSKDSWLSYISELGQFLPCHMYSLLPDETSKWREYCKAKHALLIKGGASETELAAKGNLQGMAKGDKNGLVVTARTRAESGNQKKGAAKAAGGFPCGEEVDRGGLTVYEKTSMQLDIAYKKIQEVATQYYGRKYLMPLPFNPPTSHICSKPTLNKTKCEEEGFDWGPHGMISDWFAKYGVGFCEGGNGLEADFATCNANGGVWHDPTEEINKWEIVGAGWPGVDNPLSDKKTNTSYPQNMNFWSGDGNLEAFVLFPENSLYRFDGLVHPLDFRSLDPESTAHLHSDFYASNKGLRAVKVQVDPKTHWLPIRANWELQNEKQYYKFQAGDENTEEKEINVGTDEDGNDIIHKIKVPKNYAKVGPEDNLQELKGMKTVEEDEQRPVFIKAEDTEDYNTYVAMKPYALITLPAAVLYGEVDRGRLKEGSENEICIALASCKNSNCLTSGWLMGQDPEGITKQQLQRMAKNIKNMPLLAPDLGRGSITAAAFKPWHAAVPQQSKHYKWGPWALGIHFGKPEFQIDEGIHPAVYGGEERMSNFAMNKVKMALSKTQRFIESGSVTLAGLPAYAFGSQMLLNINGTIEAGPYVTDMSVAMGSSGLTTTYNFSTTRKFGDLSEIYENKVKETQSSIIAMRKRYEDEMQRTRRGRDQYRS